ncbi:6-phosphofructokinase [Aerococcus tenax]|uniref:6-phosphofructokinase n=1 Tax=Aerococcus tenax TaxID=3078812 RepID=UPI0018A7D15A|nr:6-phosphofructokinase [Aerococcus tenax]
MAKKIAVLTSGGDAPGMNAAIRAIVRKIIFDGNEAYGVRYGFRGLADGDIFQMTAADVSTLSSRGGTILFTARYPEFAEEEGQLKALEQLKRHEIDGLVVIGGDGSYQGALALSRRGFPTVGIPGTIDNDIPGTDFTIGFDTACNTALEALDKLRDTAKSHMRTFVVEVMGRHAGDIALWSGIGCGADQVIIPEINFDIQEVVDQINQGREKGKKHTLIVLAEGVMPGYKFADLLDEYGNYHIRTTVLGHVQRGGSPSAKDRMLATSLGHAAVEALANGQSGVCMGIVDNKIVYTDIENALEKKDDRQKRNTLNKYLYDLNQETSVWS